MSKREAIRQWEMGDMLSFGWLFRLMISYCMINFLYKLKMQSYIIQLVVFFKENGIWCWFRFSDKLFNDLLFKRVSIRVLIYSYKSNILIWSEVSSALVYRFLVKSELGDREMDWNLVWKLKVIQ